MEYITTYGRLAATMVFDAERREWEVCISVPRSVFPITSCVWNLIWRTQSKDATSYVEELTNLSFFFDELLESFPEVSVDSTNHWVNLGHTSEYFSEEEDLDRLKSCVRKILKHIECNLINIVSVASSKGLTGFEVNVPPGFTLENNAHRMQHIAEIKEIMTVEGITLNDLA